MSKAVSAPRGEREDPEGTSGVDVVQLAHEQSWTMKPSVHRDLSRRAEKKTKMNA